MEAARRQPGGFGVRWNALAMFVLLIANGAVTIAEFAGIAAAGGLFGIPPIVAGAVSAVVVWLIVVRGSYSMAEKIFLVLGAALLTYVAAAVLAGPNWSSVAVESVLFDPSPHIDPLDPDTPQDEDDRRRREHGGGSSKLARESWTMGESVSLNQAHLSVFDARVRVPTYNRTELRRSIVHIGVGGFHRAHQAVYLDDQIGRAHV